MADQLGVAVFGFGRMGAIHVKNCISNSRICLRYIVELDCDKPSMFLQENALTTTKVIHGDAIETVLNDPSVGAVIIATVTHTHEALVLSCVRAKKAVFCEKPLANSYDATVKCYDAASEAGVPLLCAFNRRFDPTHSSVHDAVRSGQIGNVHVVKTCSRDSPVPSLDYIKISGGIFNDCAIHDIDMVLWMLSPDDHVCTVFAQGHAFLPDYAGTVDDVDTVTISIKANSGAMALIDISRDASYGYDQRVEVFGSKGMVQSNNVPRTSLVSLNGEGVASPPLMHSFTTRFADAYVNELIHFVDVVRGIASPLITRRSTLLAQKIVAACERSYRTGKTVEITPSDL